MSLRLVMVSLPTRTLASSTVSSNWSLSAHVDMFKSEMTLVSEISLQLEDFSQCLFMSEINLLCYFVCSPIFCITCVHLSFVNLSVMCPPVSCMSTHILCVHLSLVCSSVSCVFTSLLQGSTIRFYIHWPGGPVDFKSYWPPQKVTGPNFLAGIHIYSDKTGTLNNKIYVFIFRTLK